MIFLQASIMFSLTRERLLVIAPHPDDEVIGAGGLIAKVKRLGGKVYILYLTIGDTQDFTKKGISQLSQRQRELEKVAKFLQFDDYDIAFEGNDYHLRLDVLGQKALIDVIERESNVSIEKVKPSIVAFPRSISYNQDHKAGAEAAHAALRPAPNHHKHFVPTVLSYEEAADMWTTQRMSALNVFVPLTQSELKTKLAALALYSSQLRPFPNLRSKEALTALGRLRGAACGQEYAEGFLAHRILI